MKKLVTLAVAAAFTAPVMADTTLYGKVRVFAGNSVDETSGETETSVSGAGSRLGLKGSTALANGMTAKFQTEYDTGALIDGGSGLSARNNWAGLETKYGEVRIGNMDKPLGLVDAPLDIFYTNGTDFGARGSGAITYMNKLGPVGFAVAALPNMNGADSGDGVSAMANIKRGALYFGAGVENSNGSDKQLNVKRNPVTDEITEFDYDGKSEQALITAAYTLGNKAVVGISSFAESVDDDGDDSYSDSEKSTGMVLTGSYPMGRMTLKGQYAVGKSEEKGAEDQIRTVAEVGYKLGKSTEAFVNAFNDEEEGVDSGEGVGIGVNHNF